MTHELVSYFLKNTDHNNGLQIRLIFGCAPFLKGVRCACVIRLERALCSELDSVLKKTGISYFFLSERHDHCLVFLYRKAAFQKHLQDKKVREFLQNCGYTSEGIIDILLELMKHINFFTQKKTDFPHELGVILGYPIGDVKGFIENKGQNYLLSGYWKVYGNIWQARLTFGLYDYARTCALNEYMMGKSMNGIISMQQ